MRDLGRIRTLRVLRAVIQPLFKKNVSGKIIPSIVASLLISATAFANPIVSVVTLKATALTIAGNNFGTKSSPSPAYFNNFDSETIDAMPSNQISNLVSGHQGLVESNVFRSGLKSLEFDYCADFTPINWTAGRSLSAGQYTLYNSLYYRVINKISTTTTTPNMDTVNYEQRALPAAHCTNGLIQNDWKRNAIDLGSSADKIYTTFWVYIDKGSTTSNSWQWKGPITITSQSNLYYDLSSPANISSTTAFTSYWFFNNSYWSNSSSGLYYYDYGTSSNKTGVIATGAPQDLLAWGQWMRLEFYAQRSSSGGVADGIWRGRRLDRGSDTFNYTNAITHQTGNNPWRYVALSHAIESIYDGYVDFKVYMDDVYVDTTQARVEICDTANWAARTHCEIQPPTAWKDDGSQITVNYNRGSFADGQPMYVYVSDSNGAVNSNGFKITPIPAPGNPGKPKPPTP